MTKHIVITTPKSEHLARPLFPDRTLHVLEHTKELDNFLIECESTTVLFCAEWPKLTVDVSRNLINWAMIKAERGTGLMPVTDNIVDAALFCKNPSSVRKVVFELTASDIKKHELDKNISKSYSDLEQCQKLIITSPIAGLALTGHGAEYCIRYHDKWLSTFEAEILQEPIIAPETISALAVFLNGCSSMRLGDSVVPMEYSLAYNLFTKGAAVIGSFCNMNTSPRYSRYFAKAILSGQPLGQIVNALNRFAHTENNLIPVFQMIGDPCVSAVNDYPEHAITATDIAHRSHHSDIENLLNVIKNAGWLKHASLTMRGWVSDGAMFSLDKTEITQALNLAVKTAKAANLLILEPEDIELVRSTLDEACNLFRKNVLKSIVCYIQGFGWMQNAYAPVYQKTAIQENSCTRCNGASTLTSYKPFRPYLLEIKREECDRCGTTHERMGTAVPTMTTKIDINEDHINIVLPSLPDASEGLVFFHKIPEFPQYSWPKYGGIIKISKKQLGLPGRHTLIISALMPTCLNLEYCTFFIPPHSRSISKKEAPDYDERDNFH